MPTNLQPLRFAVSFVLYNDAGEILLVKRPASDVELGGMWDLPATGFDPKGESSDDAVVRAGREKLGCNIRTVRRLPEALIQQRDSYDLMLLDYECRVESGVPDVAKASPKGTKYTDQKVPSDLALLLPAAKRGSICTQILLRGKGLMPKGEWVTKISSGTDVS